MKTLRLFVCTQNNNEMLHFKSKQDLCTIVRCDLYYIFTVKYVFYCFGGVGGNGYHSSGSGTGREFPPIFFMGLG